MAIKLKNGFLDGYYYIKMKTSFVIIMSNRNVGKTTNIIGAICEEFEETKKGFLLVTRKVKDIDALKSACLGLSEYYNVDISWDNKNRAFVNAKGEIVGLIGALNSADSIKQSAPLFKNTHYVIMDEFLPIDKVYLKEKSQPGWEYDMLKWIIGTVRKGHGEFEKEVKILMLGNLIDGVNPYFKNIKNKEGTSLLTILAKNFKNSKEKSRNFTYKDNDLFLTIQDDKRFKAKETDFLGKLIEDGDAINGFLSDFTLNVQPITNNIKKQLKKPILKTGTLGLYIVNINHTFMLGDQKIETKTYNYFWLNEKNTPSTLEEINAIDLNDYMHFFEDIGVKGEVYDFLARYKKTVKSII